MNLLITGCGRSGTKYISEILQIAGGLDIGHEYVGKDGMVSWYAAITESKRRRQDCFPFHGIFTMRKNPVIYHQTRSPLATISSVYRTFGEEAWDYVRWYLHQVSRKDSMLLIAMKYWLYWNRIAESKAHFRYRVEDIRKKEFILSFFNKLKLQFTKEIERMLIPNRITGNKKSCKRRDKNKAILPLTWEKLHREDSYLTQRVIRQGRRYGYQI